MITDGYNVYKRFDSGSMHQRCRVHEIHEAKHVGMYAGRRDSMMRMSNFLTCIWTWKMQGKSVFDEVLAIV